MIELKTFSGQNWLITPAALALNERPPRDIHDQKWLLVLTGASYANLKGTDFDEVPDVKPVHFIPDIAGPCNWAINHHGVPRPPGVEGQNYNVEFQAELWAPFATVNGSIDEDSDWAQVEAHNWRPGPFRSGFDAFSGNPVANIFNGLVVNCVVADSDATLTLIGYNITLIGKIVFTQVIIT
jgi:hypothetical protein